MLLLSDRYNSVHRFFIQKLDQELPEYLAYHNVHHTRNVINACSYLAEKEKVTAQEKEILLVAALFHDAGFLVRYGANEHAAVRMAKEILPRFKYSEAEIEEISAIILSSAVDIEPKTLLEEILHDADLNYLGRPDYANRSSDLRREMSIMGTTFTDEGWLEHQLKFLENFEYLTYSAKTLVQSGLHKNRDEVKRMLVELKDS